MGIQNTTANKETDIIVKQYNIMNAQIVSNEGIKWEILESSSNMGTSDTTACV